MKELEESFNYRFMTECAAILQRLGGSLSSLDFSQIGKGETHVGEEEKNAPSFHESN